VKTAALKFAIFFVTAVLFAGCAGHPPRHPSVVIGGGFNPAPNQVVTLTATVSNDKSNAGVTWNVVGAGTFTSTNTTLTYTAPATVPANPVVMVTATTIATPTSFETISFTIVGTGAVSVNITNPITTAIAGSATNIVLNATVTNDVNAQGVSWQLVTAGTTTACAPGCGTMVTSTTTSFTYLPPSTVPANPSTSIIATSIADPTQSSTDTFTIQAQAANNLMFLNGSYAFEATGFGNNGNALTLAGSFVSDGNGNIVSGEIDNNFASIATNTTQVVGTYTLDSNLRGVITLNSGFNGFSDNATLAFTIDSATNTGTIVSADGEMPAVSGLLAAQNSAVFSATPSGSFVFRGTSDGGGVRAGAVGRFTIGAGGAISNGLIDSVDIAQGNDSVDDTLTGTFGAADAAGRGTVNFTAGSSGIANGSYAYYAVTPTEIFLVQGSSSAGSQFVDVARGQSTLSASSVNGTGAFGLIGADDNADVTQAAFASVAIGQMIVTGGNTVNVNCDVNDVGDLTACGTTGVPGPVPGTVTFDPTTGRGTMTFTNGFSDGGFVDSLTFYLEAGGTGVLMDTTQPSDTTLPNALVGDLIPQTSIGHIAGQVQGLALIGDNQSIAAAGEFSVANGDINGLFDGSFPGIAPLFDSATTGTVSGADTTGRSSITVTGDVFGGTNQPAAAFEADPTHFFVIGEIPPTDTLSFPSSLGIFTPQTLPAAQPDSRTATSAAKTSKVPMRRPIPARTHKRGNAAKSRTALPR